MRIQDSILNKFHVIANYKDVTNGSDPNDIRRHDRMLSNNDNILACLNRLTFIVLIAETYYNPLGKLVTKCFSNASTSLPLCLQELFSVH